MLLTIVAALLIVAALIRIIGKVWPALLYACFLATGFGACGVLVWVASHFTRRDWVTVAAWVLLGLIFWRGGEWLRRRGWSA